MVRSLLAGFFLGVLMLAAPAEAQKKPPGPGAPLYTISLAVSPSPAPVPALKYELLPPTRLRVPGNAAVDYQRAALALPAWPRDPMEGQKRQEQEGRWFAASLDGFPRAEVDEFLKAYKGVFAALDRAARAERCDWQLDPYLSHEFMDLLLNESQKSREITYYNRLRLKAHLAAGNFDAAIGDLHSGFRLAKDMAESPTTIRMLIGISLAAIAIDGAEEWVGRPEAPNLYWALDTLPKPFIDPRPALDGEAAFVRSALPEPEVLMRGHLPDEDASRVLGRMVCALPGACPPPDGFLMGLTHRAGVAEIAAKAAPLARAELLKLGQSQADIAGMPDAQAVAMRAVLTLQSIRDDQVRIFRLPHARAVEEMKKLANRIAAIDISGDPLISRYAMDQTAMEKVYHAYIRIGRRLAALQALEALRLHLATNGGRVPAQLSDVTLVAVPNDPQTGKPFEYTASTNGFTLSAPPTDGLTAHAGNSFRYDVTVRK